MSRRVLLPERQESSNFSDLNGHEKTTTSTTADFFVLPNASRYDPVELQENNFTFGGNNWNSLDSSYNSDEVSSPTQYLNTPYDLPAWRTTSGDTFGNFERVKDWTYDATDIAEAIQHARVSEGLRGGGAESFTDTFAQNCKNAFTRSLPTLDLATSPPSATRSLPRRRSHYTFLGREDKAVPVAIPMQTSIGHQRRANLPSDPLERWRVSPPNSEPASMSAIRGACQDIPSGLTHVNAEQRYRDTTLPSADKWKSYRAPSRARSATSQDSEASDTSGHSAASNLSGSLTASQRARKLSRKRMVRTTKHRAPSAPSERRVFKCTFCCDDFKHKYEWVRHEKSLHLNFGGWKCLPFGASVFSPAVKRKVCAFCNILEPTAEHLESHNYLACVNGINSGRVFQRKDHLVQHLRLVHHLDTMPFIDEWKIDPPKVSSRCGFCDLNMQDWDERTDHLASHFKTGLTMSNWQGDHGFDPTIAAQVINAIPPYVIGAESKSLVPFSATSSGTKDHHEQISNQILAMSIDHSASNKNKRILDSPPVSLELLPKDDNATVFTELLTSHLSHFAGTQMRLGIIPTDAMFQAESRKVLYGCDDEWNQTIADDPQWLSSFRQQHRWDP